MLLEDEDEDEEDEEDQEDEREEDADEDEEHEHEEEEDADKDEEEREEDADKDEDEELLIIGWESRGGLGSCMRTGTREHEIVAVVGGGSEGRVDEETGDWQAQSVNSTSRRARPRPADRYLEHRRRCRRATSPSVGDECTMTTRSSHVTLIVLRAAPAAAPAARAAGAPDRAR